MQGFTAIDRLSSVMRGASRPRTYEPAGFDSQLAHRSLEPLVGPERIEQRVAAEQTLLVPAPLTRVARQHADQRFAIAENEVGKRDIDTLERSPSGRCSSARIRSASVQRPAAA